MKRGAARGAPEMTFMRARGARRTVQALSHFGRGVPGWVKLVDCPGPIPTGRGFNYSGGRYYHLPPSSPPP